MIRILFNWFQKEFMALALDKYEPKLLFKHFKSELMDLALVEYKPQSLWKHHEREFLKLAFDKQSKPISFDKLEQVFIDSNGLKYYKYTNDLDLHVLRKGQIARLEQELYSCLSDDELHNFLEAMDKAINETDKQGHMKPNLGLIGLLVTEMRGRKRLLLHPELMFEIVAASYIRGDENPSKFDLEIQAQKVAQFREDSKGGLYDFFYSTGIKELVPFLDITQERFDEYLSLAQTTIKAQAAFLDSKKEPTLEPTS